MIFLVLALLTLGSLAHEHTIFKTHEFSSSVHDHRYLLLQHEHIDTRTFPPIHTHPHPYGASMKSSSSKSFYYVHVAKDQSSTHSPLAQFLAKEYKLRMTEYIPHSTWVLFMSYQTAQKVMEHKHVLWIGHMSPSHKIPADKSTSDGTRERAVDIYFGKHELPNKMMFDVVVKDLMNQFYSSKNALSDQVQFISSSKTSHFRVQATTEDSLSEFVSFAAQHPSVLFIGRPARFKKSNRFTRGLIQNGLQLADYNSKTGIISWDHGLDGTNQVVGVADTGIDYRHCFFAETESFTPAAPPFYDWTPTPAFEDMFSKAHMAKRKIVQYVKYQDGKDEDYGHGSHVAGTIAGSPPASGANAFLGQFSGIATGSKLAFFDISKPQDESLTLPDDNGAGLLRWAYQTGARVHSNSWGSDTPAYDMSAQQFDDFMFKHQDFLAIVAAGNSGDCHDFFTVGSPATAKNVLSVGASLSTPLSFSYVDDGSNPYFEAASPQFNTDGMAPFSSLGPTADLRVKPDIVAPGMYIFSARAHNPTDMATSMCVSEDINGQNLAVLAGTSMATPAVSGALAIVRQYFMEGYYPTGTGNEDHGFTPSAALMKAIAVNSAVFLGGVKRNAPSCDEAAAVNLTLDSFPSFYQGFGRTQLDNSLYFDTPQQLRNLHIPSLEFSTNLSTWDGFNDRSIKEGEVHTYKYCAFPSDEPIHVTLVWTDGPGGLGADLALINDLDLTATMNSTLYYGNQEKVIEFYTTIQQTRDHTNNVEGIVISPPSSKKDIVIDVEAFAVNYGPFQRYSLVISGHIAQGECDENESASQPEPFQTETETYDLNVVTKVETVCALCEVPSEEVPTEEAPVDKKASASLTPTTIVTLFVLFSLFFH